MTTSEATVEVGLFRREFEALERSSEPAFLGARRREAMDQFEERGFPTLRDEEWRHTSLAPLTRTRFRRPAESRLPSRGELAPLVYPGAATVVFVDGRRAPEIGEEGGLPDGVEVHSMSVALEDERLAPILDEHLGRHADSARHPFAALNTALFEDGVLVLLRRHSVLERPLHLLFFTTSGGAPTMVFPRTLILAETGSEATIVETYAGSHPRHLTCPVTEIVGRESSVLRHYRVLKENIESFHLAVQEVLLERASTLQSLALTIGGGLVRHDVEGILDGEGIDCTLNGLYLARGRQHIDTHMRVEHKQPHCGSHELYKGILDDEARAVFNGRIYVHKGAQKTDAKQTNRNLLLSRKALVQSNPQLEIFADDVKCTHGSTTGELDPDALFYLRTRGLGLAAARGLLTYAFASELVETIDVEALREDLEEFLVQTLPGGHVVREVR